MKKSAWKISIVRSYDGVFWWVFRLRTDASFAFTGTDGVAEYTRRDSAIRGAKRMAKRLRINAEVE
jgi:hypothetical protein